MKSAEMKCLRRVKECTHLDRRENDDIREALHTHTHTHTV
jgi:hypothetical protein